MLHDGNEITLKDVPPIPDLGPAAVVMHSRPFGAETFKYDTYAEALAGLVRLVIKANTDADGITRTFRIKLQKGR